MFSGVLFVPYSLLAIRHSPFAILPLLPKRLERQDRPCVLDARDGLDLLVDEVADVGAVVHIELHQKIKLTGGRIDFGGDLGIGDPVRHVVGLSKVAFDLDEEGNHACLQPAVPAAGRQSSKKPSPWQGVACLLLIEYDCRGGTRAWQHRRLTLESTR